MADYAGHEITELLRAWRGGDQSALEQLIPRVYRELYCAADRCMRGEREQQTLQTTALINELYLRLISLQKIDWQNRAHFLAVCARQMRRILTDKARAKHAGKRGGKAQPLSLDVAPSVGSKMRPELLALDDALHALAKIDHRKSEVVELRFYGGLTLQEIAEVLDLSPDTVERDWRLAKAWLFRELNAEELGGA